MKTLIVFVENGDRFPENPHTAFSCIARI